MKCESGIAEKKQTVSRSNVVYGYLAGAAMMLAAAIIEIVWGVKAERQPLEKIANPLSVYSAH